MIDKVQKKKFVSVNSSHGMFSVLSAHDNSVMQALVWLPMVGLSASYANLRKCHIFKQQIWGKISSWIQVNTVAESNRRPHTIALYCFEIHTVTLCNFEIHTLTLCCFEIHTLTLCCFEIHTLKLFCFDIVADHLIQSFIRFAGASYTWYDNVHSGTVGDR
jgi:hypothetical protein